MGFDAQYGQLVSLLHDRDLHPVRGSQVFLLSGEVGKTAEKRNARQTEIHPNYVLNRHKLRLPVQRPIVNAPEHNVTICILDIFISKNIFSDYLFFPKFGVYFICLFAMNWQKVGEQFGVFASCETRLCRKQFTEPVFPVQPQFFGP